MPVTRIITDKIIKVPNAGKTVSYWDTHGNLYSDGQISVEFKDFDMIEVSLPEDATITLDEAIETVNNVISAARLY